MENGGVPSNCDEDGATSLDLAWNNQRLQRLLSDTAARFGRGVGGAALSCK